MKIMQINTLRELKKKKKNRFIQILKANFSLCLFFFFFLAVPHSFRYFIIPPPGIEPRPPHCKCQVLTTGPPWDPQISLKVS